MSSKSVSDKIEQDGCIVEKVIVEHGQDYVLIGFTNSKGQDVTVSVDIPYGHGLDDIDVVIRVDDEE